VIFSVATHLQKTMDFDTEWLRRKEAGNAAFQAQEYDTAVRYYSDGLDIALGWSRSGAIVLDRPGCGNILAKLASIDAVWGVIRSFQPCVPGRILSYDGMDYSDTMDEQLRKLSEGGKNGTPLYEAWEPNLPASICAANRSLMHLKTGCLQQALSDAKSAVRLCPEFLKAHKRVHAAHLALAKRETGLAAEAAEAGKRGIEEWVRKHGKKKKGRPRGRTYVQIRHEKSAQGHTEAAVKKQEQLDLYARAVEMLPCQPVAMLSVGWIDHATLLLAYLTHTKFEIVRQIQAKHQNTYHQVKASLVDIGGNVGARGQSLMIGGNFGGLQADCIEWRLLDPENGDDLDLLPHGKASEKSRQSAPGFVAEFVASFQSSTGKDIPFLLLGQGLTELIPEVQAALRKRKGISPLIRVQAAFLTAASAGPCTMLAGHTY
jgi:hypothetical protein